MTRNGKTGDEVLTANDSIHLRKLGNRDIDDNRL